jgi:hypothetical protein
LDHQRIDKPQKSKLIDIFEANCEENENSKNVPGIVVEPSGNDPRPERKGKEGEKEGKGGERKNTHTHTPARRSEAIIPDDLAEPWERWQSFREAIDGRRIPDVQAETILMDLGRRGTDKAIRDIEFSIRKSAKSILDSDNDFEKRSAPNGRQSNPNKELV